MGDGRLEIDAVSKRYGDVVALDAMSFEVRAGELFGFVGSNGAGKTTTMRIILGVLAADSGQVRYGGRPLDLAVRRRFGYMPEERGLYPKMKVAEQLSYLAQLHGLGASAARAAVERWTERLGVASRRNDEVQKLSLGNQQRVQLAAALVHDPEVLVLDEPFSGLDPVAVDVMSEVLRERRAAGVPVMFSSHQLELVERLCDRVGIVRAGQMVACASVEELRAGGPNLLVVDAPAAPAGWTDALAGVRVRGQEGMATVLELDATADDQAVLAAALATGPVREFRRRRTSLVELFRDVVTASTAGPNSTSGPDAVAGPDVNVGPAVVSGPGVAGGPQGAAGPGVISGPGVAAHPDAAAQSGVVAQPEVVARSGVAGAGGNGSVDGGSTAGGAA